MTTRADVVAQAREWIGTPFHHQARLKGVGVDCIGLVIGVARELGIVAADFDIAAYPRTPDRTLMPLADLHMQRAEPPLLSGQIVVVDFAGDPQHFGIVAPYRHGGLSMIHAASKHGEVIETRLMFHPRMRFCAAFDLPGVTE